MQLHDTKNIVRNQVGPRAQFLLAGLRGNAVALLLVAFALGGCTDDDASQTDEPSSSGLCVTATNSIGRSSDWLVSTPSSTPASSG